jgi:hypothetical protein
MRAALTSIGLTRWRDAAPRRCLNGNREIAAHLWNTAPM